MGATLTYRTDNRISWNCNWPFLSTFRSCFSFFLVLAYSCNYIDNHLPASDKAGHGYYSRHSLLLFLLLLCRTALQNEIWNLPVSQSLATNPVPPFWHNWVTAGFLSGCIFGRGSFTTGYRCLCNFISSGTGHKSSNPGIGFYRHRATGSSRANKPNQCGWRSMGIQESTCTSLAHMG